MRTRHSATSMDKIISTLGGAAKIRTRNDDDFIDRLSHRYTTAILVMFAIVVSTRQYVGEPIHCWVDAHFTGNHQKYANYICWVQNTYYVPFEADIPKAGEDVKRIPYYQWVPLILLVQALVFYLPCLLWRSLNSKSGIDVNNIVEAAVTFQNSDFSEAREKSMRYMTRQFDRYVGSRRQRQKGCVMSIKYFMARTCCFIFGSRYGNYLIILYLVTKILYVINVLGQLFMLNAFLGTDYHVYGFTVIRDLMAGKEDWTMSPQFPRITMCDFTTRRLGNNHRYSVQCVLPINLFNEKIYIFIWFWMVMLAVLASTNIAAWLLKFAIRGDRVGYVKKHLRMMEKLDGDSDKKLATNFTENYLRQDGVFILRLVGLNTNGIVVTELVNALWEYYKSRPLIERCDKDASNVWPAMTLSERRCTDIVHNIDNSCKIINKW